MAKIKNYEYLAQTTLRKAALSMAEAGFQAIDTTEIVKNFVELKENTLRAGNRGIRLKKGGRIFVVGVGKCAIEAGGALEKILGKRLAAGIAVDVRPGKLKKIKVWRATHPFPTQRNVDFTEKIISLLKKTGSNDIVIFAVSGGGSTILCQPTNHTCLDEKTLISCLYSEGASIRDVNTVRKHLSLARGGHLAKYAYPSRVLSLIFSDIPGDKIDYVASGPTVKDSTTVKDAKNILKRYDAAICAEFREKELVETPKEAKYFKKVSNQIIATNQIALKAMAERAKSLGFTPKIISRKLEGEAQAVGLKIVRLLHRIPPPMALLYGGETTVKIRGPGRGGRNMELCLAGLKEIKPGECVIAFASDGRDNTDYAGGICDIMTKRKAGGMKVNYENYLEQNDSYGFFKKTGQYLMTGFTGSNVSDLIIAIKSR